MEYEIIDKLYAGNDTDLSMLPACGWALPKLELRSTICLLPLFLPAGLTGWPSCVAVG